MTWFRSVIALAAISMLAGCSTFPQASGPTETATPSATPSPAPTKPALSQLVVGPAGLGPLRLGSPVPAESTATAVVDYRADACGAESENPGLGLWLPSYPGEEAAHGGQGPFSVQTEDDAREGAISKIWVWSSKIATSTGVHPGSLLAEVEAAYPSPSSVIRGTFTSLYVIDGTSGRMVIEVADDAAYWGADEDGRVVWIGVQPITEQAGSIAGTDAASGCGA